MIRALICIYGAIFGIFLGHYLPNKNSWPNIEIFGGVLNPPPTKLAPTNRLRGELSFLTWIFHWSMAIDYCVTLPQYMWRWSGEKYTRNKQWKLFALLHLPSYATIGVVLINHLHRDQIVALKVMHPILVFIGSIATFYGSFVVSRAKGWTYSSYSKEAHFSLRSKASFDSARKYPSWDMDYSLVSIAFGSLLSFGSLYLKWTHYAIVRGWSLNGLWSQHLIRLTLDLFCIWFLDDTYFNKILPLWADKAMFFSA